MTWKCTNVQTLVRELGFRWSRQSKCVYVDGHNRSDVEKAHALSQNNVAVGEVDVFS